MRRFVSGLAAILLALGVFGYLADSARAVSGYDAAYFGESTFLTLNPGQSGQFAVGFTNTGSTGWVRGSGSQVDLQVCGSDKVSCGIPSPNAAWASNWLSSTTYATTSTDFVGPGQTGWFVYSIVAPSNSVGTTARFNGDLALHASGQQVHPQGYYQDATVPAGPFSIAPISASPVVRSTVQFTVTGAAAGSTLTYTVNGGCGTITSSGLFTATTPTSPCSVVATTSAGQSASATLDVLFGGGGGGGGGGGPVATAVKCGAWTTNPIANNGTATSTTTASILDGNGNLFTSGSFSVSFTKTGGTSTILVTTSPQSTSGGNATFTVRSSGVAGTDTYQASSSGLTTGSCPALTAQ